MTPNPLRELARLRREATAGPWATLRGWTHVVPAGQADRPLGASVDPRWDTERYAHPIAMLEAATPFDGSEAFVGRRFDRRQVVADAAYIAATGSISADQWEAIASVVEAARHLDRGWFIVDENADPLQFRYSSELPMMLGLVRDALAALGRGDKPGSSGRGGMSKLDEDFTLTAGELLEALGEIGNELGGCPFEPVHESDPDHHSREFVAEIIRVVGVERESMKTLLAGLKRR